MSHDVLPESVVLEYVSTRQDVREVVRTLTRKRRGLTGFFCRPAGWGSLGGLAVVVTAAAVATGSLAYGAFGSLLLVEAVVCALLPVLSARGQAKAIESMLVPFTVTVDGDGIRSVTATLDSHMAWGAFGGYIETDNLFVLCGPEPGGRRGGWIAKRGASDQAALDRLRALLDRHLPRV
ncbi:hypothetical protein [Streptomyces sp. CO7]